MEYKLRQATNNDLEISYLIKKDSIKIFVEKTWGWDESWQFEYHKSHFDPGNLKIIEEDKEPIGTVRLIDEGWIIEPSNITYIYLKDFYVLEKNKSRDFLYRFLAYIRKKYEFRRNIKVKIFKSDTKDFEYYKYLGFEIHYDFNEEDPIHYIMERSGRFENECPRCYTLLLNYPPSPIEPNVICPNPNCASKNDKTKCPKCGSDLYLFDYKAKDNTTYFTCINCGHYWHDYPLYK